MQRINTTTCESYQNCSKLKELPEENTNLRKEIENLKRILMRYENPRTPSSRRMYPTHSIDHTKNSKRFPGRPKGHKETTRPKPILPHTIKEPEPKHSCDHCGAPLNEPVHVGHHIFEEIANPKPRQVIDYIEFEYKCVMCNSYTQSRHSDCPPDGVFGKNAFIQTTLMKFEERLPFEKISLQMKSHFGLPMRVSSVLDITRRVNEYLKPDYDGILESIRAAEIVYVDETGEKVHGKKHWLWVFTTKNQTLFVIRKSRGKNVLEQVLGKEFEGYLGCDGWNSYSNFSDRLQRCWAHLLWEAQWLAEHCDEAKGLYLALKRLYADLIACLGGDPLVLVRKKVKARAMGRLRYWIKITKAKM